MNTELIWMIFIKTFKKMIQTKKVKSFIIFDDMIAYMPSNRKPNPIVTELFFRGRRLNISLSQSFEKY